uniref:DB domain-containing protein n=1 Tax=Parastrongyloides trichosuri TaxID=131310 RepID=A0A0N4ZI34_PARTI
MFLRSITLIFFILSPLILTQRDSISITNDISCNRFHESFCCTDRIRSACPQKCLSISCPYHKIRDDLGDITEGQLNNINQLLGIDKKITTNSKSIDNSFIIDGTAVVLNKDNNIPVSNNNNKGHPTLIPNKNMIFNKNSPTTKKPTTKFTLFPTLPNIFTIPNIFTTTSKPIVEKSKELNKNEGVTRNNNNKKKKKNSRKDKIIKPPGELVHIDEIDTEIDSIPITREKIIPSMPPSFMISSGDNFNTERTTVSTIIVDVTTPNPEKPTVESGMKLKRGINCGMAPDWLPCISMPEANQRLSSCCRSKNMPPGCQELCHYDVTQEEVKDALNKGKCSLFNVIPFLECAAERKNNINCCKSKNVSVKSGPQCEVFCDASSNKPNPYGILGIQHVVCGQTMYDLLQCHLSGLD